jgi:L-aminopeptidase/D-esterase-like protein
VSDEAAAAQAPSREADGGGAVSEPRPLPDGFSVGHWTDDDGSTGCTVVLAPSGARGGVDVRGGGPATRETEAVGPLSGTAEVTGVVFAGGSAYGLAAADGVVRWLEERGRGYATPAGLVPIVPAAGVYDLAEGDAKARPGPDSGYAACEAAEEGVPKRGRIGAGRGAAVGKILGRDRGVASGVGYAAGEIASGERVAVLAVANAFGDVIGEDGSVLAGPRRDDGGLERTAELVVGMEAPPEWTALRERNTTLACVMTDAGLEKATCSRVARMASGGVARAVDPVFSDVDGDVVFCLASGTRTADRFATIAVGTLAATLTAAAVRDAVHASA